VDAAGEKYGRTRDPKLDRTEISLRRTAGDGQRQPEDASRSAHTQGNPRTVGTATTSKTTRPCSSRPSAPFAETKELLAGYWLWRVNSMDEAVEWLKRAPFDGGAELEIRQVFEDADFGDEFTPELREREARMRAADAVFPPR
jgi:hypothetical protein